MDTFLNPVSLLNRGRQQVIRYKYVIALILVNFVTNYLFILQYKFYSDDWSVIVHPITYPWTESYSYLLMTPGRPIYWMIFKFQAQIFQNYALLHHITGFITTSVVLILIYAIVKKIFSDFNYNSEIFPFLTAILYCILFNKDEMYPWAVMAFAGYSLLYLISFYTYIHKERPRYLGYSLIAYTLGLFTYESGVALPLIFLAYDFLLKKDYRKSFLFAIPLAFNIVVRKTSWFGYGMGSDIWGNSTGIPGVQSIISNTFDFLSASVFLIIRQILYALQGVQNMGTLILFVLLIDSAILYILYKMLEVPDMPEKGNRYLGLLAVTIAIVFAAPYIMRGGLLSGALPTRSFEFVDIGIALLLTLVILLSFSNPRYQKILILIMIGTGMLICQGLYMNWVVSGDIQDATYRFIEEHSADIQTYDYIYLNTPSFVRNRPNAIDESVFYPVAKLYFLYIRNDIRALETRMDAQNQKMSGSVMDNEYDRYFNAKCLDNYALIAMISAETGNRSSTWSEQTVIYGKKTNVPLEINKNTLTFQQPYPGGENRTVNRSSVFEINYEKVFRSTGLP